MECVMHREGERAVIDLLVCGFLAEQRRLERAPPRWR
jgi:hypothetical protein